MGKPSIGEMVRTAVNRKIIEARSGWQYRELSPGYWGFVTPDGRSYCLHVKDKNAALHHIDKTERKRIIPKE